MLSETLVLKLVIYGQGYDGAGNMTGKKQWCIIQNFKTE